MQLVFTSALCAGFWNVYSNKLFRGQSNVLYSFKILKVKNVLASLSYNNAMPRYCKFQRDRYLSSSAATQRGLAVLTRNFNIIKS